MLYILLCGAPPFPSGSAHFALTAAAAESGHGSDNTAGSGADVPFPDEVHER